MSDAPQVIAFFRSCLRKTFRDQIIKSLRGLPGEHTHTTYRSQWLTTEVIEHFQAGKDFQAISILVDPLSELALPSRLMRPVDTPRFDANADSWNFTFELGNFVALGRRAERRLREWTNAEGFSPPNKFISMFDDDWVKYQEVEYRKSKSEWKQSIDFVLDHWVDYFQESVFLRPSRVQDFKAVGTGPTTAAKQSDEIRISLDSYNPHLSELKLTNKRLNVAVSDVMGDVAGVPKLVADGEITIPLIFLEPGNARVVIDVQPDAHFSTYIPIAVTVAADPSVDPTGPRVLGHLWRKFLDTYSTEASLDRVNTLRLFDRLSDVFPGEPELMLQRGLLHFQNRNFTAARDDFARTLEQRNDPRAVWWSLIAALHLDDEPLAQGLMERATAIQSSGENAAAFESAIAQIPELPDSVVAWFSEYPRATTSDSTSLKMLLQMAKGARQQVALVAVLKEIGELTPEVALRESDQILTRNPDWRDIRVLRANLAMKANMLHHGEVDAEILINYAGQEVHEYFELIQRLKPLIHPQRLPTILYANAQRLYVSGKAESITTAITIALTAADAAIRNGDVAEAQRCLGFLELRLLENEGDNRDFRVAVNQVALQATSLIRKSQGLAEIVDNNVDEFAADFRSALEGKTLIIFGGGSTPAKESRLKACLGLHRLEWVSWQNSEPPNPRKLLEYAGEGSILVVISVDDGLIPPELYLQLRLRSVLICRSLENLASILQSLRGLVESDHKTESYVPGTCEEALQWARLRCPNLEFSPKVGSRIAELDSYRHADRVRARIVSDLEMLNRYAADAQSGRVRSGTRNWLVLNGFNADFFASSESPTTSNNSRLREERTFSCSKGHVFMPEHLKLPGEYPTEGRIHFSTDFTARDGKVIIGYIGPHLSLKS